MSAGHHDSGKAPDGGDLEVYDLMAEFETPETVLAAAEAAHDKGYREMDAYTPFPVHGLDKAVGFRNTKLPWIVLICGVLGAIGGFGMQYFASVIHYPVNVGGRPLNSWPAFIPVTFECTILLAVFGAVFGMLGLNGLPKPYHPVFNCPAFDRASQDRFFLCIKTNDPIYGGHEQTRAFLDEQKPIAIHEVHR